MLLAMPRRAPKQHRDSTAAFERRHPASSSESAPQARVDATSVAEPENLGLRLASRTAPATSKIPEIGGPAGPEPTRYGDWERKGRCIDF